MWERRMTQLETAIFGWPTPGGTTGGLIGEHAKLKAKVEIHEASLLQARTVVTAARWAILAAAGLVTITGADAIASWVAAGIKALAAVVKV